MSNSSFIWRDLLAPRPFPAVVTGAQIRDLREELGVSARDFVSGFLGFDARSHFALETLVSSLAGAKNGGAFWINGVYGAGKSHLLGVLALLCDGVGREELGASFPEFAPYLNEFAPRLVVSIALDDYGAAQWSLEEVFWRELEVEAQRQNLNLPTIPRDGSRAESFAALEEALESAGRSGLVVLLDELSLFLGGRGSAPLQNDAAFLQFLGQHAARSRLWIVAALQKNLDDVGGLEPYALGQIRDRFQTLPLSLAHLPLLIERRLVEVRDEVRLNAFCEANFAALEDKFGRLDFGPRDWRALAPFHPATIALLERVTTRFFSRTRSAALFCRAQIEEKQNSDERIFPDAIWDYFAPELAAHPDLRALGEVWSAWEELAPMLFENEAATARRVMKFLLVAKIAGIAPTPRAVAGALLLDAGLGSEGNAAWTRQILEKLRRGAPFLALERAPDEENDGLSDSLSDRYAIDLGLRVADVVRRHVARALEDLKSGDPRLAEAALGACRGEPLPLSELESVRAVTIFWRQTPRRISATLLNRESNASLVNRVLETRAWENRLSSEASDAVLALHPPFSAAPFERESLYAALNDERASASLWVWLPRSPTRDEWDLCREVAAARLVRADPELLDNRRGRAALEHLEKGAPAREASLARVVLRLFLEGEIVVGNSVVLEASELARGDSFANLLEAAGDFALPLVYPKFEAVAPRARLLTPSNSDALCLEILRRSAEEPFFAPSLERLARHIGEPLGVAKAAGGRWRIAGGDEFLTEFIENAADGATLAEVEARFGENEWGIPRELFAVVLCALLRSGKLIALDGRGQELVPSQIGLPLRRSIHRLRRGAAPSGEIWAKIAVLTREICELRVGAPSFEEANRAANALQIWRDELRSRLELAQARSLQLRRAFGHGAGDWPHFDEFATILSAALNDLPDVQSVSAQLERAANWPIEELKAAQKQFNALAAKLEANLTPLGRAFAPLRACDRAPDELRDERADLLARFGVGEAVFDDANLLEDATNWNERYRALYTNWHRSQHDAARWNSWRRNAENLAFRALERLSSVPHPLFEAARELRERVGIELERRCARDGTLAPGEALCSSCGLRLNERLELANPNDWSADLEANLRALHALTSENSVRAGLQRRNSPLADWDGDAETFAALVEPETATDLSEALRPRRQVKRSLNALCDSLREQTSRGEVLAAFRRWLEAPDVPGDDDEIIWDEAPTNHAE